MITLRSRFRMSARSAWLFAALAWTSAASAAPFQLSKSGALQSLTIAKAPVNLTPESGGFSGFDVTQQKALDFSHGTVKPDGDKLVYDSDVMGEIALHAEFSSQAGYVLVTGYLENRKKDDRAVILDYRAGFPASGAIFSNSLSAKEDRAVAAEELEGNAFPVAALTAGADAISVAIPPDAPCLFGMVASPAGLAARFYLGISPVTAKFPNRAAFSCLVFPSDPHWGFCGALEKYYSFYPKSYQPRTKKDGLWMFQVKGIVPENIKQYGFNVLEMQSKDVAADVARDVKAGIGEMVYTLEGQREVKFLDTLPKNYDEAMAALADWTVEKSKLHPVSKENAPAAGDVWLRDEVTNSACKDFSGKYAIQIRDTPWGRKSVSFKVNPSPYLFADQPLRTVGKDSMELLASWMKQYPQIGGVLLDSYGANWPAVFDYRPDHFKYAQYPLTFDPDGHLAIYNDIGHYEFAKALREKLDPAGRLLFANGVYAYKTSVKEHYRAKDMKHRIKVGRFFDSALLDGGSSEVGARIDLERCLDVRTLMGRKYYAVINYFWTDPDKVEEFFNRSLCFGLFASNTKTYPPGEDYVEGGNEGTSYVDNPDGYLRDKKLLNWFVPKVRMLHEAGWEPATHAKVSGATGISLERFGTGNSVYFTMFNESADKKECQLEIDLAGLGFTEGTPDYKELARNVEPEVLAENKVKLTLEPYKTYIINITKPWMVGMR
jgi:hypothetical protein